LFVRPGSSMGLLLYGNEYCSMGNEEVGREKYRNWCPRDDSNVRPSLRRGLIIDYFKLP
jgi:hypothetical protein